MAVVGRPRTFCRDEALRKAMVVFWEKGYEGTTIADLIAVIGMKAPSLYAAFGNKDALFKEVVALFSGMIENGPLKALVETQPIYAALEKSFAHNVYIFCGQDNPASCLIMTAAINCAPEHSEHIAGLKNLRTTYKQALKDRFNRAVVDGELIATANTEELAEFYMTFLHGLALRAKDGSVKSELETSCTYALNSLKLLLKH